MEIIIDKVGPKNYYSEILSIASNHDKLVKNPRQKIRGLHTQALILTGISLVFLIIFSIAYMMDTNHSLYLYIGILFAVAFVLGIIYNILIMRRIHSLKIHMLQEN